MKNTVLEKKINTLSDDMKSQVIDFIDFLLSKKDKENQKPTFGYLKGKIKMSENFDEPLEDFKEYM